MRRSKSGMLLQQGPDSGGWFMRFLEIDQIAEWCEEQVLVVHPDWTRPRLVPDDTLSYRSRVVYSPTGRSGLESRAAETCIAALGSWRECLLWVVDWGVWSSHEDWPLYYLRRGERGEKRDLQTAPGHLFDSTEQSELHGFLTLVLENGWDAHLLPDTANLAGRRIWCSHDGWSELHSRVEDELKLPTV